MCVCVSECCIHSHVSVLDVLADVFCMYAYVHIGVKAHIHSIYCMYILTY